MTKSLFEVEYELQMQSPHMTLGEKRNAYTALANWYAGCVVLLLVILLCIIYSDDAIEGSVVAIMAAITYFVLLVCAYKGTVMSYRSERCREIQRAQVRYYLGLLDASSQTNHRGASHDI